MVKAGEIVTLGNRRCFFRRVFVERLLISCDSCERIWLMAFGFSIYAQQALESRPCPHCGAYTLSCQEPEMALAGHGEESWNSTP